MAGRRLPAIEAVAAERERRAAVQALACLRSFVREAWPIVEPVTPFVPNWHVDAICEHLEACSRGQIRQLLINVPPRCMKSLTVSVFWPAWEWLRKPHLRYIFSSYAASLAVDHSVKRRNVIESPWYVRHSGDRVRLVGDNNSKAEYHNTATGLCYSCGVDGGVTGRGGDRLVVDDPHNVKDAHSDAIRQAVIDPWWRQTMRNRVNDPRTAVRVVIMQRVHQRDLSGYLLAEEGDWEHLCLPQEFEPERRVHTCIGWTDPRARRGELLWPERLPEDVVEAERRALGSYGYAGQHQQRPSPEEGGILKKAHWKRWTQATRPALDDFEEVIQSWDCTFKDNKDSDFVVGAVWGRLGSDCHLLDLVRGRMSFAACLAAFEALSRKWPLARAKLVEDAANGPALESMLKRHIPGIVLVRPNGSKTERAWAIQPYQEAGNLWIPADDVVDWAEAFVQEHTDFPNGAHDDQVDTTTQAVLRLMLRARVTTSRHKPEGW